jgi:hypothetical protein
MACWKALSGVVAASNHRAPTGRRELVARERALLEKHGREWAGPLRDVVQALRDHFAPRSAVSPEPASGGHYFLGDGRSVMPSCFMPLVNGLIGTR